MSEPAGKRVKEGEMPIAQLALVLIAVTTLPAYQQQAQEEVDLVAQEFARRERVAWQAVMDLDIDTVDRFLAEDFILVDSFFAGLPKAGVLEYLDSRARSRLRSGIAEPDERVFEIRVRNYVVPNADTQIVHYILAIDSKDPTMHTSVWVRRGGHWLAVFHQETHEEPFGSGGTR